MKRRSPNTMAMSTAGRSAGLILRRTLAAAAVVGLALTGSVVFAAPASAATRAYGFQGGSGAGAGWLGSVTTDGSGNLGYCINPLGLFPSGTTSYVGLVNAIAAETSANNGGHGGTAAVAGAAIQQMNYALGRWAPSAAGNNVLSAALDLYLYSQTADYPGGVGSQQNLNYYAARAGSSAGAVKADEAVIAADTAANWNSPQPASAPKPVINVDDTTLQGTVTSTVTPVGSQGVLTLTGATQTGTGATTIPVTNGQVVNITAIPTPAAPTGFTVTANVVWTVPTTPLGQLAEYHTASPRYAQLDVSFSGYNTGTIAADNSLTDPIPNTFSPVVSTQLPASFIDAGATMDDTLVADVALGSGAWTQDVNGNFLPVIAVGTWYADPTPSTTSPTVPGGVVVLGTKSVTLRGPGTYQVTGPAAVAPGAFTVVWSIQAADQGPATRLSIPTDYSWSDQFAEVTETGSVRSSIQAVTQTSVPSQGLDADSFDTVTPRLGAGTTTWPVDLTGQPVQVLFTGTEYWVPGTAGITPGATPPAGAVSVATATVTATSTAALPGPTETVPETTDGYFVWQWSTAQTDYVDAWTEQFGDPTQVIQVTAPTVSTTAGTPAVDGTVSDTGTIGGGTPPPGSTVTFTAFEQPVGSPAPECDATTLAYTSAQLDVAGVGASNPYNSGAAQQPLGSTWFWVMTVNAADGTVLAQGACGDAAEASTAPFVINTAAAQAGLDGTVSDTLHVDGLTPVGATVTFAAYSVTPNGTSPVCTGTPAFTSAAVALDGTGDYKSGDAIKPTTQQWDWVATVTAGDGTTVLGQGTCGDTTEISYDTPARVLGLTGDVMNYTALFSAATAILVGGVAMVRGNRRRRSEGRNAAS